MTAALWGLLGGMVSFVVLAALGDMVSEEVRDRFDDLPHAILRLASLRLDPAQRAAIYDDEWLPELTFILKGDEARPITRLYHGVRYALGILIAVPRIERELPQPTQGSATESASAKVSWFFYKRTLYEITTDAVKRDWLRVDGIVSPVGSPPTYNVRRRAYYRRTRR